MAEEQSKRLWGLIKKEGKVLFSNLFEYFWKIWKICLTKRGVYAIIIHGSLVKRLRRRPLTAETRVRFPYGLLRYKSSVYTDSCETVVDTGFFVFLYGHIWNRNVGLECRNKITYEIIGIKVMHLVKLEEIPGAKEELKKIRKRFYDWMKDPSAFSE